MLIVRHQILNYCFDTHQIKSIICHYSSVLIINASDKHNQLWLNTDCETKVLLCKCTDKTSSQSAFSIQMARSFSGAYENNVVPAILVGLLIVCHPPGAICQGPLVPEPCAEALPHAPTSLTPIMPPHMALSLSITLLSSSLWERMALLYWYFSLFHVTSLFGSHLRM